jgi:hypothetical protein
LDDQGRDPIRVAEQNNQIHVARYLRKYRKLNTTLSPIGWSLIGPLLIMLLGIAPSHPWISLMVFGALIGYSASPFAPILLSGHKGYYFFFGLVYCSLAVDLVHAFRFYGKLFRKIIVTIYLTIISYTIGLSAFFCFRICLTLVAGTFYALAIFSDPGIHQVDKTKDNQASTASLL